MSRSPLFQLAIIKEILQWYGTLDQWWKIMTEMWKETNFIWKNNQINFEILGWNSKKEIPKVQQLSEDTVDFMINHRTYNYVNRSYKIEEDSRRKIFEYTLRELPENYCFLIYLDNPLEDNYKVFLDLYENLKAQYPFMNYNQGEVEMLNWIELDENDLIEDLLSQTWKSSALCFWYESDTDTLYYLQFKHPSIMILWDDDPESSDEDIQDQDWYGSQIISFIEDGNWRHKAMHIWTWYLEYYKKLKVEFSSLFSNLKWTNLTYHDLSYAFSKIINFVNSYDKGKINVDINNWSYFSDEGNFKTTIYNSFGALVWWKPYLISYIKFESLTIEHNF